MDLEIDGVLVAPIHSFAVYDHRQQNSTGPLSAILACGRSSQIVGSGALIEVVCGNSITTLAESDQNRFTFVPLRGLLVSVGETENRCFTARWTSNLHADR